MKVDIVLLKRPCRHDIVSYFGVFRYLNKGRNDLIVMHFSLNKTRV